MSVFGSYSHYYNLLYKDKDYVGETEYIHNLILKHKRGAASILNLGCGTGRHDLLLAQMGYEVTGVDQSEEMLAVANSQLKTCSSQPSTLNGSPQLYPGRSPHSPPGHNLRRCDVSLSRHELSDNQ